MLLLLCLACTAAAPRQELAASPPISSTTVLAAPAPHPADGATGPLGPTIDLAIGHHILRAEVADTEAERSLGLMYRDALQPDHGMLFVYPDSLPRSFWMRNTRIPLSIAFLDAQGVIVSMADMRPYDETPVPSGGPAMFALEMSQGWFQERGIAPGDSLRGLPPPSRE